MVAPTSLPVCGPACEWSRVRLNWFGLDSERREDMLRNASLIVCLALVALSAGCSNPPPAPPPDTRAADLQAVKDVEAAWLKDTNTKDADKYVSYFTEAGCALYPGAGILNGKAAIKVGIAPYFADPNFSWTSQSTRAMASKGGDMVYS